MYSYLLPFDSVFTLVLQPVYECEPATPETPQGEGAPQQGGDNAPADPSAVAAAAADNVSTPDDTEKAKDAQTVRKISQWVAVPVYLQRENIYYNLWQEMVRDEEKERARARQEANSRPKQPVPAAKEIGAGGSEPGATD